MLETLPVGIRLGTDITELPEILHTWPDIMAVETNSQMANVSRKERHLVQLKCCWSDSTRLD